MFLVPLDRRVGFVIQNCAGPDRELPGSAEIAHSFNQQLVLNAHRSVFHHPDDQPLKGLHIPDHRISEISVEADPKQFLMPDGPDQAAEASSGPVEESSFGRRMRLMLSGDAPNATELQTSPEAIVIAKQDTVRWTAASYESQASRAEVEDLTM